MEWVGVDSVGFLTSVIDNVWTLGDFNEIVLGIKSCLHRVSLKR